MKTPILRRCFLAITVAAWPAATHGQQSPELFKFGTVNFWNTCSPAAQPSFNRAVAMLHSFEFRDATAAFNETLKLDPECGIAYWGIALSAWGNPFAVGLKTPAQLQRGLQAVTNERAASSKSERENAFVSAVANLYIRSETIDQSARVRRYRDAMAALASQYVDDVETATFYALSLAIAADPSDKTYSDQLKAGAILEGLVKDHPDHPGLAHYIIHSYDVPALADRALHAAHEYAVIAPSAPHALHMPSHTFTRVGLWEESIKTNAASIAVATRLNSSSESLHARDYMMYAFLQTGQDAAARRMLDSLPAFIAGFDPSRPTGAAPPSAAFFAIAAIPARYALERGMWREAARLDVRPTAVPWASAISHFARALGGARSGDTLLARRESGELSAVRDKLLELKEFYWAEQTEIQIRGASAWLALAQGKTDEAIRTMRDAADREGATEKSAVTPGPLAPARELLGEMLLQLNKPAQALVEFRETLKHEPNRYRTLAGAAEAARASGNRKAAQKYYLDLLTLSSRADKPGRPEVIAARKFIRSNR